MNTMFVHDCWTMSRAFSSFTLSFVGRSINVADDCMAHLTFDTSDRVWVEEMP